MTYSFDIVDRVLYNYYNKIKNTQQTSKTFQISIKTLYNWRKIYPKSNYITNEFKDIISAKKYVRKRKKYNCKLSEDIEQYILVYVSQTSFINCSKFIKHLQKKFSMLISKNTLYGWFSKLNITYKKINKKKTFVCKKKDQLLKKLKEEIDNVDDKNNIISIDESHFELNMIQSKGWNSKGKKIYKNMYGKRKKSISLLMAISNNKVIGYSIHSKTINAVSFTDFIKSIDNDKYTYLMDNARIHHAKIFKETMKTRKSKIIYNVPYNPETNPIEHVFSVIKHYITNYSTTNITNLKKAISKSINKINSNHLNNFYKKSLNL